MNILITGGSRGLGRETAVRLSADRDNQILITGRNKDALKATVSLAVHENIEWYSADFGKPETIDHLCTHVRSVFSIVDVLVNNAGILINRAFEDLNEAEIRQMMEVNFIAPASLIRRLLPLFRKGSHIVNISSMGGFQGSAKFSGLSCYSASKAAIACLTECLATEFAEAGISVNCIAPGSAQTEMLEEAFPGYKSPVTAREMGEFIAWFAVNGHRFFNGKILPVSLTTP